MFFGFVGEDGEVAGVVAVVIVSICGDWHVGPLIEKNGVSSESCSLFSPHRLLFISSIRPINN